MKEILQKRSPNGNKLRRKESRHKRKKLRKPRELKNREDWLRQRKYEESSNLISRIYNELKYIILSLSINLIFFISTYWIFILFSYINTIPFLTPFFVLVFTNF